jgi:F0F1-type ATP synthase epsilon subunit
MGGVATVDDNIVTILTETAETPKDINKKIDSIKAELADFRRLHDETPDLNEKTKYKKDIKRCQILLDVAATVKK